MRSRMALPTSASSRIILGSRPRDARVPPRHADARRSCSHPLSSRSEISLKEASAFDLVALQEGSSLRARILDEAGHQGLAIRVRVEVFGFDGIRRMVEAGLGISILPQGAVLPYLASSNVAA